MTTRDKISCGTLRGTKDRGKTSCRREHLAEHLAVAQTLKLTTESERRCPQGGTNARAGAVEGSSGAETELRREGSNSMASSTPVRGLRGCGTKRSRNRRHGCERWRRTQTLELAARTMEVATWRLKTCGTSTAARLRDCGERRWGRELAPRAGGIERSRCCGSRDLRGLEMLRGRGRTASGGCRRRIQTRERAWTR